MQAAGCALGPPLGREQVPLADLPATGLDLRQVACDFGRNVVHVSPSVGFSGGDGAAPWARRQARGRRAATSMSVSQLS